MKSLDGYQKFLVRMPDGSIERVWGTSPQDALKCATLILCAEARTFNVNNILSILAQDGHVHCASIKVMVAELVNEGLIWRV